MPKERTPESGVPIMTKLKRQLPSFAGGRKKDIRLPAENPGERDPRLPAPNAIERMKESLDVVRGLGKQSRRRSTGRAARGRNA